MSYRKAEAIKQLVKIQKEKVSAAKLNPGKQDLYATKMLVADLENLNTDIFTVEQVYGNFRLYKICACLLEALHYQAEGRVDRDQEKRRFGVYFHS